MSRVHGEVVSKIITFEHPSTLRNRVSPDRAAGFSAKDTDLGCAAAPACQQTRTPCAMRTVIPLSAAVACVVVAVVVAVVSAAPSVPSPTFSAGERGAACVVAASHATGLPQHAAQRSAPGTADSAPHTFPAAVQATCDLSGQWTGVGRDAFTITHDVATGAVSVFSNYPDPHPANPDGKPGWASAQGTLAGTELALALDYSLVSPTLSGKVDGACSTVSWSDSTAWTRMQSITKVHMV